MAIDYKQIINDLKKTFGVVADPTKSAATYILRSGRVLDTKRPGESYGQHANIADYITKNYGIDDLSDTNGSKAMEKAFGAVRVTYWRGTMQGIHLPAIAITDNQKAVIKDFVGKINITDRNPLLLSDVKGEDYVELTKGTTAELVIGLIDEYYQTGELSQPDFMGDSFDMYEDLDIIDEEVKYNISRIQQAVTAAKEKVKQLFPDMSEFFDGIKYQISSTTNSVGDWCTAHNTLRVSKSIADETDEEMNSVIYHEFSHAIADRLERDYPVWVGAYATGMKDSFNATWGDIDATFNLHKFYPQVFTTDTYIIGGHKQQNDLVCPDTGEIIATYGEDFKDQATLIAHLNKRLHTTKLTNQNTIYFDETEDDAAKGHGNVWQAVAERLNKLLGLKIDRYYGNVNHKQINQYEIVKFKCSCCGDVWNSTARSALTGKYNFRHNDTSDATGKYCDGYLYAYDIRKGNAKVEQPWENSWSAQAGNQFKKKYDDKLEESLLEDTRVQLVSKSRSAGEYKDKSRGKNRFERKKYSKIASTVKQYNKIDMNDFFKRDILQVAIPVIGETDQYEVTIKLEGVLAEIAKNIKNNHNRLEYRTIIQALTKVFNTTNVYTKCTCPDHLYNFAHWNIVNNVSADDSAHDPGPGKNIRNPHDSKGRGCKHIMLVLANGDWMMKVASVINNYIHYAADHMSKAFLKLIFPKLYGIPAEEMVDQDLIDDEKYLDSSVGLIDAINEYGKNRGKYKPGTNKNPVTGTGGKQPKPADKKEEKPAVNSTIKPVDKKDEKADSEEESDENK